MAYTKELYEFEADNIANVINMIRLHAITAGIGAITIGPGVGSRFERGLFGERYSCLYAEGASYCIAWQNEQFVALVCFPEKKRRKSKNSEISLEPTQLSNQISDPENIRETVKNFRLDLFESALEMLSHTSFEVPGPKILTTALWSKGNLVYFFKSRTAAFHGYSEFITKFLHESPKRVFSRIGDWGDIYEIPGPLRKSLSEWGEKIQQGPYTLNERDIAALNTLEELPKGLNREGIPLATQLVSSQGIEGFSEWVKSADRFFR